MPFTDRFGPRDAKQLDKIEDTVETLAANRALLVLLLTTPRMRELVLYSATGEWIEQFHRDLSRALRKHDVQLIAEEDPGWVAYLKLAGNA